MPSRYTRFGEFFMQGLAKSLAEGTPIDVPHVGRCTVRRVLEPRLHHGGWSMRVSIAFPDSYSDMTIGMYTFGSCLLKDTEHLQLPEPTYVDEQDETYPMEHQQAWFRMLDSLEAELESEGFSIGSADDDDFYIISDYMPSDGISCLVLKPGLLNQGLIDRCQRLASVEATWEFWIRLGFSFTDPRYKGKNESLLVRTDRVVHDYNQARLEAEFPNEIPLMRRSY